MQLPALHAQLAWRVLLMPHPHALSLRTQFVLLVATVLLVRIDRPPARRQPTLFAPLALLLPRTAQLSMQPPAQLVPIVSLVSTTPLSAQ